MALIHIQRRCSSQNLKCVLDEAVAETQSIFCEPHLADVLALGKDRSNLSWRCAHTLAEMAGSILFVGGRGEFNFEAQLSQ